MLTASLYAVLFAAAYTILAIAVGKWIKHLRKHQTQIRSDRVRVDEQRIHELMKSAHEHSTLRRVK